MLFPLFSLTLCWAHGAGELCEDREGAQPRADAVEVGDRRRRRGLRGRRDGAVQLGAGLREAEGQTLPVLVTSPDPVSPPWDEPTPFSQPTHTAWMPASSFSPTRLLPKDELPSSQSSQYLSTGVWVVQVSWLLPPLVQAVVLTVAPLHHRGVLGGLGAIGYIQLHHNHTRA